MGRDERRLAAILAADVAGYSRLMGADEAGTLARFKALRADPIEPAIRGHGGRVVGEAGDSLLVEFGTATEAVACAVEVQGRLAGLDAGLPEEGRMRFRMGVNLGEVIVDGSTIHGDGVNVAARLEKLAEPGGIVVSRAVHEQVRGKVTAVFEDLGEQRLHNIAEPIRAYRARAAEPASARGAEDARRRQSIAVLPFANMSGDPEQEYFSDGITEDLITALARHHGLFVIARNSSFVFKGKTVAIPEVGRQLGVRYVVEGSVRKVGKRLRITAQLIDAETGAHVWAEKYDRDLEDVFAVQDEIVETLVWRVAGHVTKAELAALKRKRTPDVNAYDVYLAGLELNNQSSYEGSRRAKDLFEQAIAIDPGFGRAYNGLAIARAIIAQHLGTDDAGAEEYGLARKAVEVGDADEETFATLAIHHLFRQEIEQMDACISQALGINAQNPMVVLWEGWILLQKGRYLDALDRAERICRLNPFPVPREYMFLGVANFMLGRHDEALRAFAHSEPSSYYHHYFRAAADAEAGRLEEGRRHMAEALRLRPQLSAQDRPAFHPFTADMTARFVAALRKVGLPEG